MIQLDRDEARRIAVRAQLLSAERPGDIVETVDGLTVVNIDPTAAVAPSADHILWSRLGWPYQPADLARAVEHDRTVFEWAGFYRPMSDLALYLPLMRAAPRFAQSRNWLAANDRFHREVLARLRAEGPLRTSEIPDTSEVSWPSSGWTNDRNVTQLLEILAGCGEVAVTRREGKERVWDLAERVYPQGTPDLTADEARTRRDERRLSSLGIAPAKAPGQPVEPLDVGEAGDEAEIEGVPGRWRVDPPPSARRSKVARRSCHPSTGSSSIASSCPSRSSGSSTSSRCTSRLRSALGLLPLPILHHDRLVGKLDGEADRKAGLFRVNAVHEDEHFTEEMMDAVSAEILDLADWLGLTVTGLP